MLIHEPGRVSVFDQARDFKDMIVAKRGHVVNRWVDDECDLDELAQELAKQESQDVRGRCRELGLNLFGASEHFELLELVGTFVKIGFKRFKLDESRGFWILT